MALFGSAAMSDLSPECAPKRTSADYSEFMGSRPSRICHVAAVKRSKRRASRSRSGRSLTRFGKCIVPPWSRFRASSIGPSFCPSRRSGRR